MWRVSECSSGGSILATLWNEQCWACVITVFGESPTNISVAWTQWLLPCKWVLLPAINTLNQSIIKQTRSVCVIFTRTRYAFAFGIRASLGIMIGGVFALSHISTTRPYSCNRSTATSSAVISLECDPSTNARQAWWFGFKEIAFYSVMR